MIDITPIPAFRDNYLWLLKSEDGNSACIVDPGDAEPVLSHLKAHSLTLSAIFITHHHADHTGGIGHLLREYDVPVYGPRSPNITSITEPLVEGDTVTLFGHTFHILEIPGHTIDHIAYYTLAGESGEPPMLFCGDTLFAGGCGRVFEGTPGMMHQSLQKLAHLAPATKVYCAHEYTLANLDFARAVTPDDKALLSRIEKEQQKRHRHEPTVPSTIAVELETNPFLRCSEQALASSASRHSGHHLTEADQVFAEIRRWKDHF